MFGEKRDAINITKLQNDAKELQNLGNFQLGTHLFVSSGPSTLFDSDFDSALKIICFVCGCLPKTMDDLCTSDIIYIEQNIMLFENYYIGKIKCTNI